MLNAKEVGELLGLSASKVYELARSGELVSYRFGDAVRFEQADVEAYKQSCRVTRRSPIGTARAKPTVRLESADSDLAAYFRAAGVKPRPDPRIAQKERLGKE